jgi:hypothetical protein
MPGSTLLNRCNNRSTSVKCGEESMMAAVLLALLDSLSLSLSLSLSTCMCVELKLQADNSTQSRHTHAGLW